MQTVSLFEAKTHLSRLVEGLVSGKDDQIIISRHGKPVALVTPYQSNDVSRRIGLARGRFSVPDNIDGVNKIIESMFHGKARE